LAREETTVSRDCSNFEKIASPRAELDPILIFSYSFRRAFDIWALMLGVFLICIVEVKYIDIFSL